MHEQDTIEWESYEFEYKEKTADWFWAVAIATLAIAAIAVIESNPLFALFIIIAGAMIIFTARKTPRIVNFRITTKGIEIDSTLYHYGSIKAFWIEESRFAPPKLLVSSQKFITPVMVIPIETDIANTSEIRTFLLAFVPEEKLRIPLSHIFMEFIGF